MPNNFFFTRSRQGNNRKNTYTFGFRLTGEDGTILATKAVYFDKYTESAFDAFEKLKAIVIENYGHDAITYASGTKNRNIYDRILEDHELDKLIELAKSPQRNGSHYNYLKIKFTPRVNGFIESHSKCIRYDESDPEFKAERNKEARRTLVEWARKMQADIVKRVLAQPGATLHLDDNGIIIDEEQTTTLRASIDELSERHKVDAIKLLKETLVIMKEHEINDLSIFISKLG